LLVLALPEESAEESATATPVMATAIPVEPPSPVADSRSNRLTWMAAGLLGLTTTLAILIIRRRPLKDSSLEIRNEK
jgi:hypothetical protein